MVGGYIVECQGGISEAFLDVCHFEEHGGSGGAAFEDLLVEFE